MKASKNSIRVAIPVFDGVEELDAVGPWEVFGVARQCGAPVECCLVAPGRTESVRAFHGLTLGGLEALEGRFDLVVVPGGAWLTDGNTGVRRAIADGVIPRWVASNHADGAVVAGVCTGVFVLEAAGLLAGRRATTHHLAMADLAQRGVEVCADRVVDEGSVITAGGITSALDLAMHLTKRYFGTEVVERVRSILEYRI